MSLTELKATVSHMAVRRVAERLQSDGSYSPKVVLPSGSVLALFLHGKYLHTYITLHYITLH